MQTSASEHSNPRARRAAARPSSRAAGPEKRCKARRGAPGGPRATRETQMAAADAHATSEVGCETPQEFGGGRKRRSHRVGSFFSLTQGDSRGRPSSGVAALRGSGSTARFEAAVAERLALATAVSAERRRGALESLKRLPPRSREATRFATGHRGTSTASMCKMADGEPTWAPGGTSGRRETSRKSTCFCPGLRETSTSSMCEMADGPWAPEKLRGTGDGNEASVQGSGKSVDSQYFFFHGLSPFLPPLPPPPRSLPLPPPPLRRCSLADLLADLTASQPPPR